MFLDHVSYSVRQYVPKQLQCTNCRKFGHSLYVCRSEFAKFGNCGENECEEECEKESECLLCKDHAAWEDSCPQRVKEKDIIKARSRKKRKR